MSDVNFMKLAIRKAGAGIRRGQTPFAACIVKDGRVLSCAHNTVMGDIDITAHAEINAIRNACKRLGTIDLSGSTIFSTCEPCPMCFGAIHWAGISRIVYGARIEDAAAFGFRELPISIVTMKSLGRCRIKLKGNVLRKQVLELFRSWQGGREKKGY